MTERKQHRRHITRLDYDRSHGWWVRFARIRHGKVVLVAQQQFSDGKYGGKQKALVAAVKWRDQQAKLVDPPRNARLPPGHGYVRRAVLDGRDVFEGWMRLPKGKVARTKWHVDVWGPIVAKRRCNEWLARKRLELAA